MIKSRNSKTNKRYARSRKNGFRLLSKNPSASQSLKGSLYEEKIIDVIKSKMNLPLKK